MNRSKQFLIISLIALLLCHGVFSIFDKIFDALLLKDLDLILISAIWYAGSNILVLYMIVYGLLKDIMLFDQLHGVCIIQFSVLYIVFAKMRKLYYGQTFAIIWLHFTVISILYHFVAQTMLFVLHGVVINLNWLQTVATIAWFPIIQWIIGAKKTRLTA